MRDIKRPITLEDPRDRARRRQSENMREWVTGFVLGIVVTLFLIIALAHRTMAAPINSPADAQRSEAVRYLSENRIVIPEEIEEACVYYGAMYDICPEVLEAVCWVESNCQPTAQDASKACKGLMQIKPSAHSRRMARLGVQNIFDIYGNIKTGTDYLAEIRDGEEDIAAALYIYNGNKSGADRYHRTKELTGYPAKVLRISEALERAHGK